MNPIAIFYATREGQTQRIAEHVGTMLHAHGFTVEVHDVRALPPSFSLMRYGAAIVAASVHGGHHEPEMVDFAKQRHLDLAALPAAFLSVSLTEASVERAETPPEVKAQAIVDVQAMLEEFFAETGWYPTRVLPIAGALRYRQYGVLTRFVMRQIAKRSGVDTDTSRDHEYTDWRALDRFVDEMAHQIEPELRL